MGQYYVLANFDTKEMIEPHAFGNGMKFAEQVGWEHAFSTVTHYLVAKGMGRGGGDFEDTNYAGKWAGQRFALIGDYATFKDFDFISMGEWQEFSAFRNMRKNIIYRDSRGRFASGWKNISTDVAKLFGKFFNIKYTGSGWKGIKQVDAKNKQPNGYDEEIEGSSLVKHIKFDRISGVLQIEFHTNLGAFYVYTGVDTATAMDFLYSDSKGKFYHQFIRGKFTLDEMPY